MLDTDTEYELASSTGIFNQPDSPECEACAATEDLTLLQCMGGAAGDTLLCPASLQLHIDAGECDMCRYVPIGTQKYIFDSMLADGIKLIQDTDRCFFVDNADGDEGRASTYSVEEGGQKTAERITIEGIRKHKPYSPSN